MVSEEVSAPSWLHRFIIGRGGENIKSITQDLHVTVNFPNEGDVIVIEGPPEEVQVARESLENFTDGLVSVNTLSIHYCELSIHYCELSIHYCELSIHYCELSIHYCELSIHYCELSIHYYF